MANRWIFLLLLTIALTGCAPKNSDVVIVPSTCELQPNQEFPLSLKGSFSNDAKISWEATKGSVNPSEGLSVVYTAPSEPGTVIITAVITVGGQNNSTNIGCSVRATSTDLPAPLETATQPVSSGETIAISEIMGDPCGGDQSQLFNEYIELFNYGDNPIDINGWWIATTYSQGSSPSQIVAWNVRNPDIFLGSDIITNLTTISPKQYALVLEPGYYLGSGKYAMPYFFPPSTTILTTKAGNRIANEISGMLGTGTPTSTLVLYKGTETFMGKIISTYGSPVYGSSPQSIRDDEKDKIPLSTGACNAAERIVLNGPDVEANWKIVTNGSLGK